MIFPQKHITLAESIFGLSHVLLNIIKNNNKISIDELWFEFEKLNANLKYGIYHSFDNFLLAIDLLYMLDIIKNGDKGVIEI